ncbi:MAG: hypothetical protein KTR25_14075 [Myxococcales bacterium]|nr:hypothetical protein [Myxococcales bacterium]
MRAGLDQQAARAQLASYREYLGVTLKPSISALSSSGLVQRSILTSHCLPPRLSRLQDWHSAVLPTSLCLPPLLSIFRTGTAQYSKDTT